MEKGVHLCYERALRGTAWGELPHSYVTVLDTGRLLINEFPSGSETVNMVVDMVLLH